MRHSDRHHARRNDLSRDVVRTELPKRIGCCLQIRITESLVRFEMTAFAPLVPRVNKDKPLLEETCLQCTDSVSRSQVLYLRGDECR